jgi:hypothetical protein
VLNFERYSGRSVTRLASVTSTLPAFHFFGLFGAVVVVAASYLTVYFMIVFTAIRERVSAWRQDLLTAAIFFAILGIGLAVRMSVSDWDGRSLLNLG